MGSHRQRAIALERRSLHWRAPRLQARAWSLWAGTLTAHSESVRYLRRALANQQCRAILRGWRCWAAHCARQTSATERLINASVAPARREPRVGTACHRAEREAFSDGAGNRDACHACHACYADDASYEGDTARVAADRVCVGAEEPVCHPSFDRTGAAPSFYRLLDRIVVLQQLVVDPAHPARGQKVFAAAAGARVAAR